MRPDAGNAARTGDRRFQYVVPPIVALRDSGAETIYVYVGTKLSQAPITMTI